MGLIIAIDDLDFRSTTKILDETCDLVDGYKFGIAFLIKNSLNELKEMRKICNKMWIADLKLADIGYIMIKNIEALSGHFNAVIAHSFVGISDALDMLFSYCKERGIKPILVATMSHKGAREIYDFVLIKIKELVEKLEPWGLVAPATRRDIITYLREILDIETKILSPGIGPQGALPGDALCAGADYEIVGRLITNSPNPKKAVEEVLSLQKEALKRCKRVL